MASDSELDARYRRELAKRRADRAPADQDEVGELVADTGSPEIVYPFTNRVRRERREVGLKHAPRVQHVVILGREVELNGTGRSELVALQRDSLETLDTPRHRRDALARLRAVGACVQVLGGIEHVTFKTPTPSDQELIDARILQQCRVVDREWGRVHPRVQPIAEAAFRLGSLVRLADVTARIADSKRHPGPKGARTEVKRRTLELMRVRKVEGQAFKEFLREWERVGEIEGLELEHVRRRADAVGAYRIVTADGQRSPDLQLRTLQDWFDRDAARPPLRGNRR